MGLFTTLGTRRGSRPRDRRHRSGNIARSTARGVAVDQALDHHIVVTISPGIAGCFQSVLLETQNNNKRSLTLRAAAASVGIGTGTLETGRYVSRCDHWQVRVWLRRQITF
jgi:hypothetical protein